MSILLAVLIITGLGIAFGVGLALAARKFAVKVDPRQEKVAQALPQVNCGACGMPGCAGFAEALITGATTVDRCVVMNEDARALVSKILGVETKSRLKQVALLHCNGGIRAKDKFSYVGIADCTAASLVHGGPKACPYGCIGLASCVRVCPFDALSMGKDNLPVVDEEKCTACGKCVERCPKKLFKLVLQSKAYANRCSSLDFGKKVTEVCSAGCIGCRRCEKTCPIHAITVTDNLAVFDYKLCDNKGACFAVCPTKSIAHKNNHTWEQRE